MEIREALVAALEENGWQPVRLAAAIGITEAAVKKWVDPEQKTVPGGDTLLAVIRVLPGFGRRIGLDGAAVA